MMPGMVGAAMGMVFTEYLVKTVLPCVIIIAGVFLAYKNNMVEWNVLLLIIALLCYLTHASIIGTLLEGYFSS